MKMIDITELWPRGNIDFFGKLYVATHKKVEVVCEECGGNEIRLDAWARWDTDIQDWVLSDTMDSVYCCDCGGETRAEETGIRTNESNRS